MCKTVLLFLFFFVFFNYPAFSADSPPKAWIEAVVEMSGVFETSSGDKNARFTSVTRDFDCEGLTLGVLNWTIGQDSFAGLFKQFDAADIDEITSATMPNYGNQFVEVINLGLAKETGKALKIVRSWQRPAYIEGECDDHKREGVTLESHTLLEELKRFLAHPKIKHAQVTAMAEQASFASRLASKWAKRQRGMDAKVRFNEFAFFYDLVTQNGTRYISALIDVVSQSNKSEEWQSYYNRASTSWIQIGWDGVNPKHEIDGERNATRWRGAFDRGEVDLSDTRLLLFAAIRGMLAKRPYSTDTINRKGLMIMGFGWTHGDFYDYRQRYKQLDQMTIE